MLIITFSLVTRRSELLPEQPDRSPQKPLEFEAPRITLERLDLNLNMKLFVDGYQLNYIE